MQDFYQYLNPIHSTMEQIFDTKTISPSNKLEVVEFPYLESLIKLLEEDINAGLKHMAGLSDQIEHMIWVIDNETGDDKSDAVGQYNKLMKQMEELIERLNRLFEILDVPYFGKVLFERRASDTLSHALIPAYIGKFGYFDKNTGKASVSDWRSPIANLYYNNSGPQTGVSFETPVGTQSGDLTQKLQFDISMGRINEIYSAESGNTAVDEFLVKELKRRSGEKLKEIVSTIQAQQNSIIREDVDSPILIQGVAGSGKTTIILHRMAYLMYAYADKILPERSIVIAPNKLFMDYISDVLPSLGVKGMQQNTYLFWAREAIKLSDRHILDDTEPDEVKLIKGSEKFIEHMKLYIEQFIDNFFETMPTTAGIDVDESFQEIREKHPEIPFKEMVELAVQSVFSTRIVNRKLTDPLSKAEADKERERKIKDHIKRSIDIYQIYTRMYDDAPVAGSPINDDEWFKLKGSAKTTIKKNPGFKGYSISDLAPMVMISDFIYGRTNEMYDHILVDEAQDLSPFQILTLAKRAKRNNITIAGDTAQSIIPPFHYKEWSGLQKLLSDELKQELKYHDLHRSYRSTQQIIEFSNRLLASEFPKTYELPEAVLRTGDEVEVVITDELTTRQKSSMDKLINEIKKEVSAGSTSVAVICRDEAHSDRIYKIVSTAKLGMPVFSHQMENFHDGVQVLPVRMAKGLEFSSVIVVDLSKENYDDEGEARLLYVSFTRALHRLKIIAPKNDASRFLADVIE